MAMDIVDQAKSVSDSVEVKKSDEGWLVTIMDKGEKIVKIFRFKAYATSFADGQRIRLNLLTTVIPSD